MATKLIITNEKADLQIIQTNGELDCLQENIAEAPYSLALLRQIMLLSTRDFSLVSSLRATIVQVCNAGYQAFFTAHTNMDKIKLACDNAQEHSEMISKCVIEGEDSTITTLVPISLKSMHKTAKNCAEWNREICSKFYDTLYLLGKVHCSYHIAQVGNQEKLEELERQKTKLEFEGGKDIKMAGKKISEAFFRLKTTDVKKQENKDVKDLLKDGIQKVAELEAHWKQLVTFFAKISNVTEVAMGKAIGDFVNAAENANLQGQGKVAEGSNNSLKIFTRKKLIQFAFNEYSRFNGVSTVSKSYLEISDKYLMPSLIHTGTLLVLDAERNLEKISSITKEVQSGSLDFVKEVVTNAKLANKNEVKKRLLNINSMDLRQYKTRLTMATKLIISKDKADSQISQTSEELDCLGENIIVAPYSLALLGQLMLLSTQGDFSLISKPEETSEEVVLFGKKEESKLINHPESFRATLVQVNNAGYYAFLAAHTNMDKIRLACENAQEHVELITECIIEGEDDDITTMMPASLKYMRKTAQECAEWSREICSKFHHTLKLLEEVQCSCYTAQMTNKEKFEELERQKKQLTLEKEEAEKNIQEKQKKIENMKLNEAREIADRKTSMGKMEALSNKISEALIKINTADVKKLDIEGIKKLLKDGIENVAHLEAHWIELVRFFEKISIVTEVMMGNAIEDFANVAESAKLQGNVAEGSSNSLKSFTKKKLIQYAFNAYSRCNGVSIVSKSYLKISNTHLMSSIIQLGTLVAIDAERDQEKIYLMTKEIQCTSQMTIHFVKLVVINAKLENENEVKKWLLNLISMDLHQCQTS